MQRAQENTETELIINWKYFSLEQVNSEEGPKWKIWKQPDDYPSRGLGAFRAAEAARLQGKEAFDRFHSALLKARHEQHRDIADRDILIEVAESVGLEMTRFSKDLGDRKLLTRLAQDHTFAVKTLGIFGTPTLVFLEKQAIYLKMSSSPAPEDSFPVFVEMRQLAEGRQYIQEVKRPQPPDA